MQNETPAGAGQTPKSPSSQAQIAGGWLGERPFMLEKNQKRFGGSMAASIISHVGLALLAVVLVRAVPEREPGPIERIEPPDVIWTVSPGPGGGGGGGGNNSPEPIQKAELPGEQKVTVPVEKKPELTQPKPEEPKPEQAMNIPALTTTSGIEEIPGALTGLSAPSKPSQGTGTGGGAGTGSGTGIGEGTGSGLGPGSGGGTGGGVYRPGSGIINPQLLFEKKPEYTADAMRAKIQGAVILDVVVMPDGSVGDVKVARSLDRTFGLDEQAIRAVRQWRFKPAVHRASGKTVPILVTVELTFTLR